MAKLQLIARNFSSENHRIETVLQNHTVSVFYKKRVGDEFETVKFFTEVFIKENYLEKLQRLLHRVEEYSGLKLIKSPLKIIKNDREHQEPMAAN